MSCPICEFIIIRHFLPSLPPFFPSVLSSFFSLGSSLFLVPLFSIPTCPFLWVVHVFSLFSFATLPSYLFLPFTGLYIYIFQLSFPFVSAPISSFIHFSVLYLCITYSMRSLFQSTSLQDLIHCIINCNNAF